jgi:hypothetical protein
MPGPASVSDDGESSFTTGPATEHTRLLPQSGGTMVAEYSPSARTLKLWATVSLVAASLALALLLPCWIMLKTTFEYSSARDLDDGIRALALFVWKQYILSPAIN